ESRRPIGTLKNANVSSASAVPVSPPPATSSKPSKRSRRSRHRRRRSREGHGPSSRRRDLGQARPRPGWDAVQARHPGRSVDVRRTFWACPSDKFRMVQPADMPLEAGHGGPRLGSVVHVELRKDKRLWIVAELLDGFDLTRQPWQLSYDLIEKQDGYQLH